MTGSSFKILIPVALLAASIFASAQKPADDKDRFVRLMSAQSVQLQEIDGRQFRRADGPARFLHNDTWLICDTALWSVDDKVIYAMGHVCIEQENTELKSDKLTYYVDRNLAEFRGSLVQLLDKENNVLRTNNLDYNTKDSVAVFRNGGAFRDKDGQLIESAEGRYDSKQQLFEFFDDVNMFSDSVFVMTSELRYESEASRAIFPVYTEAWKEDGMLSGDSGWYNNNEGRFFFTGNVHAMTSTREGWCDSLYFFRSTNDVEMLGNAQVVDTTRSVTAMSDKINYFGKESIVRLTRDPVVLLEFAKKQSEENLAPGKDTVYMRADTLAYWSIKRCKLDSTLVSAALKRVQESREDPVANIRAKAAEEAAKARQEAIDKDPNAPPEWKTEYKLKLQAEKERKEKEEKEKLAKAKAAADSLLKAELKLKLDSLRLVSKDSLSFISDSLALVGLDSVALKDSLLARKDSLDAGADSSSVGFLSAIGNVKVFKSDMQAVCDSLVYCDLDSLARLFKDPVVWNDVRHQYNADSLYLVIKDGLMQKAMLLSNAFIHVDEDGSNYDQIRSTEMAAFFNKDMVLTRFDAMGSTTAIFYLREKERIATANRKETTMMSATLENGEISKITYYDAPKSDAFPVAQMSRADKFLKGYKWQPEKRPQGPMDITSRVARAPQRSEYEHHPKADFHETERYFPGYMDKIYRGIAISDSLDRVREARNSSEVSAGAPVAAGSAEAAGATAAAATAAATAAAAAASAAGDGASASVVPGQTDSLQLSVADSLRKADSLYNEMTPAQKRALQREQKKAEREAAWAAKQAEKEAEWAEKDALDKAKKEAKEAAKEEKKRQREREWNEKLLKQRDEEDLLRKKYVEKYTIKHKKLLENGKLDF